MAVYTRFSNEILTFYVDSAALFLGLSSLIFRASESLGRFISTGIQYEYIPVS